MQINSFKTNTNRNISFGSLRPEKLIAEKVLKEFHKELGYLQSGTRLQAKINQSINYSREDFDLRESLWGKAVKINEEIYDKARADLGKKEYSSLKDFINDHEKLAKRKHKANCWEDALMIFQRLKDKGLKPQMFEIAIKMKGVERRLNHFSTVIGLKKEAKIENPATWGSKALVVDAWSNIIMKADDAIEFFKKALQGNFEIEKISLENGKKIDNIKFEDATLHG